MKFKLTGLGIFSLILYVLFNIWSSRTAGYSPEQMVMLHDLYGYDLGYLQNMNRVQSWSLVIGLLSVIPSIDFFIKGFKKHARGEMYTVSTLTIVLTILSFGIPFFTYAFTSFIMKIAFGSNQEYTSEKWGFWILSILTLGIVWIGMLIILGPTIFMYRIITRGVYKLEEPTGVETASLIVATILTLGFIWIGIGIAVVFVRYFFVKAWNVVMNADVEFDGAVKVWFWILSILTLGILPLSMFSSYFTYELFLFNAEDQVV